MTDRVLFQSLESRVLFSSVALTNGELLVQGDTATANNIVVSMTAGVMTTNPDGSTTTAPGMLSVQVNSDPAQTFDPALVTSLEIRGGAMADTIAVDETGGQMTVFTKIFAGKGDDTVMAGSEDDLIFGGDGNDTISTGAGKNMVHGQKGNDLITGGTGNDKLFGDQGINNTITGNGGSDKIHLGKNDVLTDFADSDQLTGPGAHKFKQHGHGHGHTQSPSTHGGATD